MAEAEENREKRCFSSMQMEVFSRDLLHKFMNGNNNKFHEIPNEEDELELSLGLSLNGRFGVDPERAKRLKRSSSISNFVFSGGDESNGRCSFSVGPIARTCSLPVEGEEECRKRKELQSLRRLEAKRKRMEKLRVVKDKVDLDEHPEENGGSNNGPVGNSLPLSQGSMASQGSGSSGISDFGSQPIQGPGDNSTGANTPTSIKPSEQEHEQKQVAKPPKITSEKPPTTCNGSASKEAKEMFKNYMLNMPCVSTTGNGPNAEFVKHAGGGDVANPLKQIVVNPSPLLR
ncbi:ninja-family protein AFP3 isoform X2 [Solanum pennellii]|uniref:Ninja-family protein n=1 Tax=Solanum pennellii TaxID=28526 RepID=A0ABM1V4W9_SOLPN|nr:ninja-family protein AFP3 isoform X2 [Solanum pennellii]